MFVIYKKVLHKINLNTFDNYLDNNSKLQDKYRLKM